MAQHPIEIHLVLTLCQVYHTLGKFFPVGYFLNPLKTKFRTKTMRAVITLLFHFPNIIAFTKYTHFLNFVLVFLHFMKYLPFEIRDQFRSFIQTLGVQHSQCT